MKTRPLASPSILGYALLGLLARGEQSGYDLSQGLKDPVSYFWHAQHSQIYPELARLEAAAFVQHTRVEQSDRPDKKVYRLTPAGDDALRAWLAAATEVPKKRDEVVLKAYSIWLVDPAGASQMMRDHMQVHAARQAEFERRLACLEGEAGGEMWRPASPWFGIHAALRRGIGYEREYRDWCEWVLRCLSRTMSP
jgi:PadR family transcriptional regulator AphA